MLADTRGRHNSVSIEASQVLCHAMHPGAPIFEFPFHKRYIRNRYKLITEFPSMRGIIAAIIGVLISTTALSGCVTTSEDFSGMKVKSLTAGYSFTCAITLEDNVSCWGWNEWGQLGNGEISTYPDDSFPTPADTESLGEGRTAVEISSGGWHTCVILDDGSVSCWGWDSDGQLGDGEFKSGGEGVGRDVLPSPTSTDSLGEGRTAVAIDSGPRSTCVILDDGSIACWGDGYGDSPAKLSLDMGQNATATHISLGSSHGCAILDDGSVRCWGENEHGQLGVGENPDSWHSAPDFPSGRKAVEIASGGRHTCAILDDGSVNCWGDNYLSEIGDGTTDDKYYPTETVPRLDAVDIAAGDEGHTCAILSSGKVSCWGSNEWGKLGSGVGEDEMENRSFPEETANLGNLNAVSLHLGFGHTCATLDDMTFRCWGAGYSGQLGNGAETSSSVPV